MIEDTIGIACVTHNRPHGLKQFLNNLGKVKYDYLIIINDGSNILL